MIVVGEPKFLTRDEVLFQHNESLARYGGSSGIRELGLGESALASALNTFFCDRGDLFDVAAAYAYDPAESQAFTDGLAAACSAARVHESRPMLMNALKNELRLRLDGFISGLRTSDFGLRTFIRLW